MISCLKVKRQEGNNQKIFIKNGGLLLEEQVALCNGRSNPIRHFSEKELLTATNYYDERLMFRKKLLTRLYKGSLNGRSIIVKKYTCGLPQINPYKDTAVGSQMSAHKNVLKVLGCCLETKYPAIVYEFADTKTLFDCIYSTNVQPLPWKSRVKIAADLANVFTYLHTAFSRPVINRGIESFNILLDQNNVPKFFHFGRCISIPEGQSYVEDDFLGALRVFPPQIYKQYFTEKFDVYVFGALLFELLTGQLPICASATQDLDFLNPNTEPCFKDVIKFVDQRIAHEQIEEQLLDYTKLIRRCMSAYEEDRPTMKEAAKELRRIHQSF